MEEAKIESAGTVAVLRDELMHARNELELARIQLDGYEKTLAETRAELDQASEMTAAKTRESSQLRTDIEILQAQISTSTTKMANVVDLSARHSNVAKKLAATEDAVRASEADLKEARKVALDYKKEVENWQNRALALEAKIHSAKFPKVGSSKEGEATFESVVVQELRQTVEKLRARLDE